MMLRPTRSSYTSFTYQMLILLISSLDHFISTATANEEGCSRENIKILKHLIISPETSPLLKDVQDYNYFKNYLSHDDEDAEGRCYKKYIKRCYLSYSHIVCRSGFPGNLQNFYLQFEGDLDYDCFSIDHFNSDFEPCRSFHLVNSQEKGGEKSNAFYEPMDDNQIYDDVDTSSSYAYNDYDEQYDYDQKDPNEYEDSDYDTDGDDTPNFDDVIYNEADYRDMVNTTIIVTVDEDTSTLNGDSKTLAGNDNNPFVPDVESVDTDSMSEDLNSNNSNSIETSSNSGMTMLKPTLLIPTNNNNKDESLIILDTKPVTKEALVEEENTPRIIDHTKKSKQAITPDRNPKIVSADPKNGNNSSVICGFSSILIMLVHLFLYFFLF